MGSNPSHSSTPTTITVQPNSTPNSEPTVQRSQKFSPPSERRNQGSREAIVQDQVREEPGTSQNSTSKKMPVKPSGATPTGQAKAGGTSTQGGVSSHGQKSKQTIDNDDIVFETFHHNNGRVYTCLYRSGIRYYLDNWKTEEWQIFPMSWYSEGRLVTESLISNGQTITVRQTSSQDSGGVTSSAHTANTQSAKATTSSAENSPENDDRESTIRHPTKGKLPTYIFEVKRNVNCYYDEEIGKWIKMPIGWELHSDMVRKLIDEIQEALPEWIDRCDILASLRLCNYNIDDCIETYFSWAPVTYHKTVAALHPVRKSSAKKRSNSGAFLDLGEQLSNEISQLKVDLDKCGLEVEREKDLRLKAEKQAAEFQKKYTDLEAEARVALVQMEVMQQQQMARPKTAGARSASTRSVALTRTKTPEAPTRTKTPEAPTKSKISPPPQVITETVVVQTVEPQSIVMTQQSVLAVHKVYNGLKLQMQQIQSEINSYILQISEGLSLIKVADKRSVGDVDELRKAYRKECIQRKLLYNQLQELRGNIRVFCRCRQDDRVECCLKFTGNDDIQAPGPGGTKKQYRFDKVYGFKSTQAQVFEDTLPIISSCVDGYNVCILAYGQTGSGKTHTMMGPEDDPGVNIRSMRELLKICEERDAVDYTLKCSILEIYNEAVQDLLTKETKALEIRAHGKTLEIPGLTSMEVNSVDDIKKIMKIGDENRSVASTKMNISSSRSHLVMIMTVTGLNRVSKAQSTGILTLCDLAGSERVGKSEATGQRLVEAAAINKSLSALGQVFTALRTNQLHVPYRNSKLTHILQPCLGGDAKVAMFLAVSPDLSNISESISTLTYGSNAAQVQLGQAKQNLKTAGPD